ncbi:MAG: ATP-binding protein, partial [Candidatus Zixiibacteriota bacterium]
FLSYARAERTSLKKVELCHVVTEALEMLRRHPSYTADIELDFNAEHSMIYVMGDDGPIKQIVYNLLLNAAEALTAVEQTEKRVRVTVTVDQPDKLVTLGVADNGPGITSGGAMNIFTPFYSTKSSGSGLGLSIVHRLAELMEVDLEVETGPGEGAAFRLVFSAFHGQAPEDLTEPRAARRASQSRA